jgi:hypothetical protein
VLQDETELTTTVVVGVSVAGVVGVSVVGAGVFNQFTKYFKPVIPADTTVKPPPTMVTPAGGPIRIEEKTTAPAI